MNNIILEANSIAKVYGAKEALIVALQNISLSVKEKEILAIVGPSGSGKSTLLNILGCLDRPTNGQVYFQGTEVSVLSGNKLAEIRSREIGFIFQQFNLIPRMTALENVILPLFLSDRYQVGDQERAIHLLEKVGLGKRMQHKPDELSGGEQQRVAIARALINNPSLVIADEPTGNLDTKTGGEIMHLIGELNRGGKTLIVATHNYELVSLAHRIINLKDGVICNGEKLACRGEV